VTAGQRHRAGVVVGKFLPPHAGHHALIETAQAACDHLTVVLFGKTDEPIPLAVRRDWLRDEHPGVRVVAAIDDHRVDYHDDATWRHWVEATRRLVESDRAGPAAPDAVFSSEPYGAELAQRLGATHVAVDIDRVAHPVSGTLVRADPLAAWDHLRPRIRAHFVKRVAVIGAESTGKSTLCATLARELDTVWVPEYGRAYSEQRGLAGPWRPDEFAHIARVQRAWEDEAALAANRVLVCDTDALATTVWQEKYAPGTSPAAVAALIRPFDRYLVTAPDVPWVDDGLRDGEHDRRWMHEHFLAALRERGARYEILEGSWDARHDQARRTIAEVLREPWAGSSYRPVEHGTIRRA
jgi:HTH-type transcriptional repressor of NAD biosynthesis genes